MLWLTHQYKVGLSGTVSYPGFGHTSHLCVYLCVHLQSHVNAFLPHPSLVQSFVGSLWNGPSQAASMSSTVSCSTCIASPMWSCWWATLTCTVTYCPSTMTTITTRPSPQPTLYSGCSSRGKVCTEEVFGQSVPSFHLFAWLHLLCIGNANTVISIEKHSLEICDRLLTIAVTEL